MKKSMLLCAGICGALMMSSCTMFQNSSESAYRKAYEKAKAQENQQAAEEPIYTETPVVTPLETRPASQVQVQNSQPQQTEHVTTVRTYDAAREQSTPNQYNTSKNPANATYRSENVTVVNGSGLKGFNVVVGSFSLKANAEGMQQTLKSEGYDAQLVFNADRNMYRVIASTHADKEAAVSSRNKLREGKYHDAWLLYAK